MNKEWRRSAERKEELDERKRENDQRNKSERENTETKKKERNYSTQADHGWNVKYVQRADVTNLYITGDFSKTNWSVATCLKFVGNRKYFSGAVNPSDSLFPKVQASVSLNLRLELYFFLQETFSS
jgi:hypothetical protein